MLGVQERRSARRNGKTLNQTVVDGWRELDYSQHIQSMLCEGLLYPSFSGCRVGHSFHHAFQRALLRDSEILWHEANPETGHGARCVVRHFIYPFPEGHTSAHAVRHLVPEPGCER